MFQAKAFASPIRPGKHPSLHDRFDRHHSVDRTIQKPPAVDRGTGPTNCNDGASFEQWHGWGKPV
ncbi:MAG: hypothetical protein D6741_21335 [Planctomycetota bacterium]|nr:MAG: hypothetical protein D6741_21335 [Planctomycetota bacterium]